MSKLGRLFFSIITICLLAFSSLAVSPARAAQVNITASKAFVEFTVSGKTYRIERNQDQKHRLTNSFAKTSRACPPFCIHPIKAAKGVVTVGEIELLEFMKVRVEKGKGLLIDARIPAFYKKGTIPGAINIPFNLFAFDQNPYLDRILAVLGGVKKINGDWDFSNALDLLLFCNGPWCDQSPRAIRNLIDAGYPANKLFYYRGGMQNWQSMGLTVAAP